MDDLHFSKWPEIKFKLDTRVEVTDVSRATCTWELLGKPKFKQSDRFLPVPAGHQLQVLGHFSGSLSHKEKEINQKVFVIIPPVKQPMGLPSITASILITRLKSASIDVPLAEYTIKHKFSK